MNFATVDLNISAHSNKTEKCSDPRGLTLFVQSLVTNLRSRKCTFRNRSLQKSLMSEFVSSDYYFFVSLQRMIFGKSCFSAKSAVFQSQIANSRMDRMSNLFGSLRFSMGTFRFRCSSNDRN